MSLVVLLIGFKNMSELGFVGLEDLGIALVESTRRYLR